MKRRNYNIPEGDEKILLDPDPNIYAQLLEQNRTALKDIAIFGSTLGQLSRQARAHLLEAAIDYSNRTHPWSKQDFEITPDTPILATGHQPIVFHPGLCLKNFVMAKTASKIGAIPILFVVDSDEFRSETVPLPVTEQGLARFDYYLFPQRNKVTYESAHVEPADLLWDRLNTMGRFFFDAKLKGIETRYHSFLDRLKDVDLDMDSFSKQVSVMRRAWERPVEIDYLEAPVSAFCCADVFIQFYKDAAKRARVFAEIYNGELAAYRKERKLRYPSNPVPDLDIKEDKVELPFWIIIDNKRLKPYVTNDGRVIVEGTDEITDLSISDGKCSVRPRAFTLSIYLRLFLTDFFIHGVGGAKYDTITDRIIKRFYDIDPPAYGCVSATLYPGIETNNPTEEIDRVSGALRGLDHHPEKSALGGERMGELAGEKADLVTAIKSKDADKKSIGARIAELNREMSALLEPHRRRLEEQLGTLKQNANEWEVASARDYPCFLYTPDQIVDLLE